MNNLSRPLANRSMLTHRWRLSLTASCIALLSVACSSLRVGSDYDHSAGFANYHTYAWLPRAHYAGVNPLVAKRAKDAIDAELKSRGYAPAEDPTKADFVVNFTIGARDRLDVQSYPTAYRGAWRWGLGYYGEQVDVRQYREGTLAIDVFDGATHQPVWSGWATKEISQSDQERSTEALRNAAASVLARFPPGGV